MLDIRISTTARDSSVAIETLRREIEEHKVPPPPSGLPAVALAAAGGGCGIDEEESK